MKAVLNIGLENNRLVDPRTFDISPLIKYLDLFEIEQYHVSESKWRDNKERVLVATVKLNDPIEDVMLIAIDTGQDAIAIKIEGIVYSPYYEGEEEPFDSKLFIDEIELTEEDFNTLNTKP